MAFHEYSIGIDLGTTNCALAWVPLNRSEPVTEVLEIAQRQSLTAVGSAACLPSFLYLPTDADRAAPGLAESLAEAGWIVGRFAREQAARLPGRTVHSAKSWFVCHGMDRTEPFLPWGSNELSAAERVSPVDASALLLGHLRDAWDRRFPGAPLAEQRVTVTVPASFDALAQRLTLEAAARAGFPPGVGLLEEPQAAFYRWLEAHETTGRLESQLGALRERPHHVLVIDVGGGTTDFSLFEIRLGKRRRLAEIRRLAVSDHVLLGGDNIDLALAHRIEPRLGATDSLSADQWAHLVARCRQAKEDLLDAPETGACEILVPARGSRLFGAMLRATLTAEEVQALLLDGFYPECPREARPEQRPGALRELGLPYAADSAVTRHLAAFLADQPPVDAILCNGGSLQPDLVRSRLASLVRQWQPGHEIVLLDNPEPSLAVARGAARFGLLAQQQARRIQAGAARSLYLEAATTEEGGRKLLCVLPSGTPPDTETTVDLPGLKLRTGRPVQFGVRTSAHRPKDRVGDVLSLDAPGLATLTPLHTVIRPRDGGRDERPVRLAARLNALGWVQVACVDASDPGQRWPLEFDLHEQPETGEPAARPVLDPGVPESQRKLAEERLRDLFHRPYDRRDPISPTRLTQSLEKRLGLPKGEWNAALLRGLWPALHACFADRERSYEHEETWVSLAGLLLRPGYGVRWDETRMDQLWEFHEDGFWYPGKAMQVNADILWRRVAGGLDAARQIVLFDHAVSRIREAPKKPSPEAIRLTGSLERVDPERKIALVRLLLERLAAPDGYPEPCLVALGRLLGRMPLYGSADTVVPPDLVAEAFQALKDRDWKRPEWAEAQTLFLRAARIVEDRSLDLPRSLRHAILDELRRCGLPGPRLAPLEHHVPLQASERVSLFGESLPAGLVLD
jgi:molecular chaperone DnaK (HSP70)